MFWPGIGMRQWRHSHTLPWLPARLVDITFGCNKHFIRELTNYFSLCYVRNWTTSSHIIVTVTNWKLSARMTISNMVNYKQRRYVGSFWNDYQLAQSQAFAKPRTATISFVMSVRKSAGNNSAPTERIFMKFRIWIFFENVEKIQVWLNLTTAGTLHEDLGNLWLHLA
jgi:hypothetical protein